MKHFKPFHAGRKEKIIERAEHYEAQLCDFVSATIAEDPSISPQTATTRFILLMFAQEKDHQCMEAMTESLINPREKD